MKTYIALLRGINVSGKNKILMADLRQLFEKLGFKNVQTYIQSGNVIFNTEISKELLSKIITDKIKEVYDYEIPIMIRTPIEIEEIINKNPFLNKNVNLKNLYVFFLNKPPLETKKLDEFDFGNDEYKIIKNTIYIKYEIGAGKTKLSNKIIETKLKVIATARNWRTTNKLVELCN